MVIGTSYEPISRNFLTTSHERVLRYLTHFVSVCSRKVKTIVVVMFPSRLGLHDPREYVSLTNTSRAPGPTGGVEGTRSQLSVVSQTVPGLPSLPRRWRFASAGRVYDRQYG